MVFIFLRSHNNYCRCNWYLQHAKKLFLTIFYFCNNFIVLQKKKCEKATPAVVIHFEKISPWPYKFKLTEAIRFQLLEILELWNFIIDFSFHNLYLEYWKLIFILYLSMILLHQCNLFLWWQLFSFCIFLSPMRENKG